MPYSVPAVGHGVEPYWGENRHRRIFYKTPPVRLDAALDIQIMGDHVQLAQGERHGLGNHPTGAGNSRHRLNP